MLSPSVRGFVFEIIGKPLEYRPGQAIDLFVRTASGLVSKRPYSIASAPSSVGANQIELAVTLVANGPTSTALHAAAVGTVYDADGPRGAMVRWPADLEAPTLFVATGSGLAPLRAMLQAELARGDREGRTAPRVSLLFGCRTRADILWAEELSAWACEHERFSIVITLSRPDAVWTGATGYVQKHVASCVQAIAPERAFVCGLSPMVEDVVHLLAQTGLPRRSVRTEEYDT